MHKNRSSVIKKAVVAGMATAFMITPLFAQQETPAPAEGPSGILLWAMLGMIAVLGIVLIALTLLLNTTMQLKYGKVKGPVTRKSGSGMASIIVLLVLLAGSNSAFAQETQAPLPTDYDGMDPYLFYILTGVIVVLLALIGLLYRSIMMALKPATANETKRPTLLEKLNASVPLAEEEDVMMDHEYDGIRELDNNLPPWWIYGFYVTILFAGIYLWRFHVSGSGKLQLEEYKEQVATANAEVEAYKKKMGNLVDESNVTALSDASAVGKGKTTFIANCAACHGQLGEGLVGPNLTDAYWLHGGGVKDIFKTIKYGWPQKGMKSWEKDFSPVQIQELASFILTLKGTNPPNAKEQQGDLYQEAASGDSTATAVKADL